MHFFFFIDKHKELIFYFRETEKNNLNYNLFVNILTSLKTTNDLKWTLKPRNLGPTESQGTLLSNYQKKNLLEQNIKKTIQKVCSSVPC